MSKKRRGSVLATVQPMKYYKLAKKAYDVAKTINEKSPFSGTIRRFFKKPSKKRSPQYSTSGGFFRKKGRKSTFARYTKYGTVTNVETGTSFSGTTPSVPLFVGHGTHANTLLMRRVFWRTIIRDLFTKHGNQIIDIETLGPGTGNVIVEYQVQSPNVAPVTFTQATAGNTYNQIAGGIFSGINAVLTTVAPNQYFYINEIRFESGGIVQSELDLRDVRLSFMCKSDLKVQNRTVAVGTDEDVNSAENVSNQPLYGKFYSGSGNGPVMKLDQGGATQKSLLCSDSTGILTKAPAVSEFWLKDVPEREFFTPLPRSNKVSIEPGTVKTSSLTHTITIPQLDFWKMLTLNAPTGANSSGARQILGKYYIMALEKMICVSATDSNPTLGLELNQKMGCIINYKRIKNTAQVFEDPTYI